MPVARGSKTVVVEARGLTKWFGPTTALDEVDLAVEEATIHGLVGPNGAGKTTLLSCLFGLVLADEGTLRLFGRTRAEGGAAWLDRVGGFVEAPRFYPYLSGRRNLDLLAGLDGPGGPATHDLLGLVGLAGAAGERVRGYSLGMRQRLGLAAALLRRPRLLVLDEPTNGMDPAGSRELRSALRHLAGAGTTVVLSSHDMEQVEGLCDAVTVLCAGRVEFDGSIEEMQARAPEPVWHLITSDDGAAAAAAGSGVAVEAHASGRGLRVHSTQEGLDAFVVTLGRAGTAVRSLALEASPLESLFFRLTEHAADVER